MRPGGGRQAVIETCSWTADLAALEREYNPVGADLRFAALSWVDRRLLRELARLAARAPSDARPDDPGLQRLLLLAAAAGARLAVDRAACPGAVAELPGLVASL